MAAITGAGVHVAVRLLILLTLAAGLLSGPLATKAEAGTWYTGASGRCMYTAYAPWKVGSTVHASSDVMCRWKIKAIEHEVSLVREVWWGTETLDFNSYYCAPPYGGCKSSRLPLRYDCYRDGRHEYFMQVTVRVHFYDGTRAEGAYLTDSPHFYFTC